MKNEWGSAKNIFRRLVEAGGMSRIVHWLFEGTFAIISAERKELSDEANERKSAMLRKLIVSDGFGFFFADGMYRGRPEKSALIPKMTLSEALEYGRLFKQDSIVWGENGKASVYGCENGEPYFDPTPVEESFTFVSPEEIKLLIERKDKPNEDIGTTDVVKTEKGSWTIDSRIREWREKMEALENQAEYVEKEEKEKNKVLAWTHPISKKYAVISDEGNGVHILGGNISKIIKTSSFDGRTVYFNDERFLSRPVSSLLVFLPLDDTEIFSEIAIGPKVKRV